MPSPSRKTTRGRGFTLIEAIIAAFLLLTSLLVVAALVDSGLRTQAKSEQYLLATTVASTELDKLRGYAERFGLTHLDGFDGQTFPSETDSSLEVRLKVSPYVLAVPNSSLESQFPENERKLFHHSSRFLKVRVSWSDSPEDAVELTSLVSDWAKRDFRLKIEALGSTTLDPDGTVELKASAGNLEDLIYTWYTEPLDGLGSMQEVARDGRTAVYSNRYRTPANRFVTYPGKCRVVVRAKYREVVKTAELIVENLGVTP